MSRLSFWLEIIKLILDYGPRLVGLGIQIYQKINTISDKNYVVTGKYLTQSEKGALYNKKMRTSWVMAKGALPSEHALTLFRERIWRKAEGRHAIRSKTDHIPKIIMERLA
jgi:hypothetical protein